MCTSEGYVDSCPSGQNGTPVTIQSGSSSKTCYKDCQDNYYIELIDDRSYPEYRSRDISGKYYKGDKITFAFTNVPRGVEGSHCSMQLEADKYITLGVDCDKDEQITVDDALLNKLGMEWGDSVWLYDSFTTDDNIITMYVESCSSPQDNAGIYVDEYKEYSVETSMISMEQDVELYVDHSRSGMYYSFTLSIPSGSAGDSYCSSIPYNSNYEDITWTIGGRKVTGTSISIHLEGPFYRRFIIKQE